MDNMMRKLPSMTVVQAGSIGGNRRAQVLTAKERVAIAKRGAEVRTANINALKALMAKDAGKQAEGE